MKFESDCLSNAAALPMQMKEQLLLAVSFEMQEKDAGRQRPA